MAESFGCSKSQFEAASLPQATRPPCSPSLGLAFAFQTVLVPNSTTSKPEQSPTLWIQSSKNSPVFILFTKMSAMLFCRTCDFSSCSCTNYRKQALLCPLEWNPSASGSSCARCRREYPAWSAGWSRLRWCYLRWTHGLSPTHDNGVVRNLHIVAIWTPHVDRLANLSVKLFTKMAAFSVKVALQQTTWNDWEDGNEPSMRFSCSLNPRCG